MPPFSDWGIWKMNKSAFLKRGIAGWEWWCISALLIVAALRPGRRRVLVRSGVGGVARPP